VCVCERESEWQRWNKGPSERGEKSERKRYGKKRLKKRKRERYIYRE